MKVVMLYQPRSDSARQAEDYVRELERLHQTKIELVSLDTVGGAATADLYEVLQNPAILVLSNDGQLVKDWQGTDLPLMAEVSYYTHI